MIKIINLIIMLLSIVFIGCKNESSQKESKLKIDTTYISISKKTIQNDNKQLSDTKSFYDSSDLDISKIERLPKNIVWTGFNGFYFIFFKPNKVNFDFSVNCAYWFPSKIIKNEIIFFWAINEDCAYDRGIKKIFPNIKNPEIGKPFGKIKIINDSTLFIYYYYSDWVEKVNQEQGNKFNDTLFPKYLIKVYLN